MSAPFSDSSGRVAPGGQLRRSSSVPLYFQLAEILKERIEAGRWPAGARFPSERELSEEFEISRTVIRPALELLQSDGQLTRIKGRGTFVTPPKAAWKICGLTRLLYGPRKPDVEVRVLSASEQRAEPDVQEVLELESDTVVQATAVVLSTGSPIYMTNSFIPGSRLPDLTRALVAGSPTQAVRTATGTGPELLSASASVATAFVSRWEAAQLELSAGDPCFLIRYVERMRDGGGIKPVEFARVVFRSDVVELDLDLA